MRQSNSSNAVRCVAAAAPRAGGRAPACKLSALAARVAPVLGHQGLACSPMGINGLKGELTHEVIDAWQYLQCGRATKSRKCVIDASNPLHLCAVRHPKQNFIADHRPAMGDWRRMLEGCIARNLDFSMVFDGGRNPRKINESLRRSATKEKAIDVIQAKLDANQEPTLSDYTAAVQVTGMMTLMAVKVCRDMGVAFVVAYEEADPHLAAAGCPVISADTDMLALGVAEWIAPEPGFWYTGKAKLYRPDSWVGTGFDAVYKQHGARGFQYAGALLGNDFTELACGVYGLGPLAVVKILTMVPAAVLNGATIVATLTTELSADAPELRRMRTEEREALASADGCRLLAESLDSAVGAYVLAPSYMPDASVQVAAVGMRHTSQSC